MVFFLAIHVMTKTPYTSLITSAVWLSMFISLFPVATTSTSWRYCSKTEQCWMLISFICFHEHLSDLKRGLKEQKILLFSCPWGRVVKQGIAWKEYCILPCSSIGFSIRQISNMKTCTYILAHLLWEYENRLINHNSLITLSYNNTLLKKLDLPATNQLWTEKLKTLKLNSILNAHNEAPKLSLAP